jgi:diguanylate cyclase (GGDEF)-like protein
MQHAEIPADDAERLATLRRYGVLDTPAESSYDDLLRIATAICGAPMGTVSLVDADRQWFKARVGVEAQQTPRDIAFCAHTVLDPGRVFEVNDAKADARFSDSPLVTGDPNIRFYAGAPLVASDGHAVGALCVMDTQPHQLSDSQRTALEALSRQVVALMELRAANAELKHHLGEREWYERELDARAAALREDRNAPSAHGRTDGLTGLANRRGFGEAMRKALATSAPFAFAIVDVDRFKEINDGWGHPYGDRVLIAVAGALRDSVDNSIVIGRIGGEEFGLVLTGCNAALAQATAEGVRAQIGALAMEVPLTASVGVTVRREGDEASDLYARADAALYEAKRLGRDRVVVG